MKRLITAIIIISVLITSSILILVTIYNSKIEITTMVNDIITATENGDYNDAYSKSVYLNEHWDFVESKLVRYIRHGQLDIVTYAIAKLPYLLKYEEYGEFLSELDQIKVALEHIWKSEVPTLNNIF